MHIPKHFKITDEKKIFSFIEANSFGQLISNAAGRVTSTHLPFLLSSDKTKLLCHLAKQNLQLNDIDGQEALISLQGSHGYISPSWYKSAGVPTWNYQAVHIYGSCSLINNPNEIKQIVEKLTEKYEADFSVPWRADYQSSMLNAIVGIEIHIRDIQCQYKLSQNRSIEDQQRVIENLKEIGSTPLAKAMIGLNHE